MWDFFPHFLEAAVLCWHLQHCVFHFPVVLISTYVGFGNPLHFVTQQNRSMTCVVSESFYFWC